MIRSIRPLLLAGALAFASAAAAQDVQAGVDAWQRGAHEEAIRNWRPLADRGDADAQFNLGHAYRLGRGVPQNLNLAEQWYERAARQGHVEAEALYGLLLFQNNRQREGLPWIERAAGKGDPHAQFVLGTVLFNGDLAPADLPRAYALMTAASRYLPQAQQQLAAMEPHLDAAQKQQGLALAETLRGAGPIETAAAAPPPAHRPRVSQSQPHPAAAPPPETTRAEPPRRRPDAPAAAPPGRWRVQLGAFSSEANARRHWDEVRRAIPALAGLEPRFERAGALTRLQASGLTDRAAADRACAAVKRAGKACFAVAP